MEFEIVEELADAWQEDEGAVRWRGPASSDRLIPSPPDYRTDDQAICIPEQGYV